VMDAAADQVMYSIPLGYITRNRHGGAVAVDLQFEITIAREQHVVLSANGQGYGVKAYLYSVAAEDCAATFSWGNTEPAQRRLRTTLNVEYQSASITGPNTQLGPLDSHAHARVDPSDCYGNTVEDVRLEVCRSGLCLYTVTLVSECRSLTDDGSAFFTCAAAPVTSDWDGRFDFELHPWSCRDLPQSGHHVTGDDGAPCVVVGGECNYTCQDLAPAGTSEWDHIGVYLRVPVFQTKSREERFDVGAGFLKSAEAGLATAHEGSLVLNPQGQLIVATYLTSLTLREDFALTITGAPRLLVNKHPLTWSALEPTQKPRQDCEQQQCSVLPACGTLLGCDGFAVPVARILAEWDRINVNHELGGSLHMGVEFDVLITHEDWSAGPTGRSLLSTSPIRTMNLAFSVLPAPSGNNGTLHHATTEECQIDLSDLRLGIDSFDNAIWWPSCLVVVLLLLLTLRAFSPHAAYKTSEH
jgi:hypothetical protein